MKFFVGFLTILASLPERNYIFAQNKEVGDSCMLHDDKPGQCKLLENCEEVLSNIQFETPEFCSDQNTNLSPIVCCPTPKVTVTQKISTTEKNINRYEPPDYVKITKSYRKCLEWSETAYVWKKLTLVPNDPPQKVSQCGFEVKPLIIGGEPAKLKEFPHMVLLGYGKESNLFWECGGSLISEQYVLTARHCLFSRKRQTPPVKVHVGLVNLLRRNETGSLQIFNIAKTITPPDVQPTNYDDIALLKLDKPVIFTEYVRPACLHVEKDIQFESALATGWGTDMQDVDKNTDEMMKVKLTLIDHDACNETYQNQISRKLKHGIVDNTQFCAGDFNKDTCQGDSGGPLQIYRTDIHCMYDIIGITSFGLQCGIQGGVYTRVSHYVPWIEEIVWPDFV